MQSHLNTTLYLLFHVAVLFPFADMLVIFVTGFSMGVNTFHVCVFFFDIFLHIYIVRSTSIFLCNLALWCPDSLLRELPR